jgi:hypothetical protein
VRRRLDGPHRWERKRRDVAALPAKESQTVRRPSTESIDGRIAARLRYPHSLDHGPGPENSAACEHPLPVAASFHTNGTSRSFEGDS